MPWARWGSPLPALRGPTLVPRAALGVGRGLCACSLCCSFCLQQFGKILDVEIIFNERGSKVGAARGWHCYRELRGGGRGSRDAWGLLCLRSPPLLPRRTRAQGGPMSGHPCPAALCWPGGTRVPVPQAPEGGEGRGGLTLPVPAQAARVPLCVLVSAVSSLLSVPLSQTLLPAHGDAGASAGTPGASRGPSLGSLSLHCGSLISCASSPDSPPLSLCPRTLSLSLSVFFFLLFSSAHRVLGL